MHVKKAIFLISSLLLITFSSNAQDQSGWLQHYEIGGEKSFYTSVDIYSAYWETSSDVGFTFNFGNEFVVAKKFLTAPKIGVTFNVSQFFFLRSDFSLYNNIKTFRPVLTPKIGIGLFGMSLFYGRNISLNRQTSFQSLGKNQFGLSITLIPKVSYPFF